MFCVVLSYCVMLVLDRGMGSMSLCYCMCVILFDLVYCFIVLLCCFIIVLCVLHGVVVVLYY